MQADLGKSYASGGSASRSINSMAATTSDQALRLAIWAMSRIT